VKINLINRVMVNMLAWSVVDPVFEPRLGQSKNTIGICCFSAKQAA
jgi:hypothetical protein